VKASSCPGGHGEVGGVHDELGEVDERRHRGGDRPEAEPDRAVERAGVPPGRTVEPGTLFGTGPFPGDYPDSLVNRLLRSPATRAE
jgi:hypothetical protein